MQRATTWQPRMKNPGTMIPEARQAIQALLPATGNGPVPPATLNLVHLRASQINGCSSCVNAGSQAAKKAGETDERLSPWPPGGRRRTSPMPSAPRSP